MSEEFKQIFKKRVQESIEVKQALTDDHYDVLAQMAEKVLECYKQGGMVIIFGNGGSAADAQHIAAELVSKFYLEREGLPAIALNTNTSVITAVGNDYGYDRTFARQVEAFAEEGDIVIGISTSGNSPNVLAALEVANERGAYSMGFAGMPGSKICDVAKLTLNVPSSDTPRIQEVHITAGHILCEIVESTLFKE